MFFIATNVTHRLDTQKTSVCLPFLSCPLSLSLLHLMKRKEESMEDRSRKKLNEVRVFGG